MAEDKDDKSPLEEEENRSEQGEGHSEIINLMKELHQSEMQAVKDDISSVKVQIEATEARLNIKLDQIDIALRGDTEDGPTDGIGLFEQHRRTRTSLKVMFFAILLLYGVKLYGITLENFVSNLFSSEPNTSHVEPESK